MRRKTLCVFLVLACALWGALPVGGREAAAEEAPAVVIISPDFEFKPVPEGAEVKHDFIVQNKGNGLLKIEEVKTA
jgi:hypothetical protein